MPSSDSEKLKQFTLLSSENSGISFSNVLTDDPSNPEKNVMDFYNYYNGGGVAVGDFNKDGLEDLVFTGNEVDNKLYINTGNLSFKDVTEGSNINQSKTWTTGVMVVDINDDGYDDIYICQSGPFNKPPSYRRNLLFINNKDLTFSEQAEEYGLADTNISEQAVFFDMDNDDDLDCFVLNNSIYVRTDLNKVLEHLKDEENLARACSNLYRNDNGKFTKITKEAGMMKYGFGLSVIVSDINEDGWLDVYQTNDYSVPDFMYINQKDGTFSEEIKARTKNISWFSMGADIADYNNDGYVDIGVVDMAATDHVRGKTLMAPMSSAAYHGLINELGYQKQHMFNVLQRNNGDGTFNNVAGMNDLLASEWSWATFFADFDNDGWKDYFVSNGFRRYARDNDSRIRLTKARNYYGGNIPIEKRKELYAQMPQVKIPNYCYKNKEGYGFEEVGDEWGVGQPSYSNGAAYADLDNDGDLDLVVNDIDGISKIYRNNSQSNYLQVNLVSDKPLEGTKVFIHIGDQKQMLEYGTVRGFQSSVTKRLHFGLADNKLVSKLEVFWRDGKVTVQENVKANQMLTIDHKTGSENKKAKIESVPLFIEIPIDHRHVENEFDDYAKEVLVPYKQSTIGPFLSGGDVNNDGLEDFYVGGAKGSSGALYLQTSSNEFVESKSKPWNSHSSSEDMGSVFVDIDGDTDLDLYVVSGGNDFDENDDALKDRIYINDGAGNFSHAAQALDMPIASGSRVLPCDYDNDGDMDLFVAGRQIPGKYPYADNSVLLENKNGIFKDVTNGKAEGLSNVGMVNDAVWFDVNADERKDLVIAGEWMGLKVFINSENGFKEESDRYFPEKLSGWNFKISATDIDNDGDVDLIVGNLGLNSKFHANKKKPFYLHANDFDGNGTCDIVLAKNYKGKKVPVRGRECSSEQMPFISEKFETYGEFANASLEDILGEEKIKEGLSFTVNEFSTGIYFREGDSFVFKPLPKAIQESVTNSIVVTDLNKDGRKDLILGGNIFNMEIETTPLDASNGYTLIQKENGEFEVLRAVQTGLDASKDVKDMVLLKSADGATCVVVANNNDRLQIFKTNN
jgi:hypothetical protein